MANDGNKEKKTEQKKENGEMKNQTTRIMLFYLGQSVTNVALFLCALADLLMDQISIFENTEIVW